MIDRPSISCQIDTTLFEVCPKNCRLVLKSNSQLMGSRRSCIAKDKMNGFLEGKTTFNVGISAFYQACSEILDEFISERNENLELISYYLSISDPDKVSDTVENLSNEVIFILFKENYNSYLKLKDNYKTGNRVKNFFHVKGNRFWQGVGFRKICDLIQYIVREKKEFYLASQFLILLPTGVISNLPEYTGLVEEEIKNLYLGLGDVIYELPINNPGVYPHMMEVLKDEMEISLILGTMEELVKRQEKILMITQKLIEYYEEHSFGLSIQHIYSELNGLDAELVTEILNQLRERKVLSDSQKDMLNMIFQKGSIDFLKSIKNDILS